MRALLFAIGTLLCLAAPAFAGDYSERRIIGFSPDGAFFAFEEFGVEDGSGFPYANIYVIETATDEWVTGSPFLVRIDTELATLDAARDQAARLAFPMLKTLGIAEPGRLVVANPITELALDPLVARFLRRALSPLPTEGDVLTVVQLPFPAPGCPDLGVPFYGYNLIFRPASGLPLQLHRDTRIPVSRGCPVGYGISDVILFDRPGDTVMIVMLNVFKAGFEGPDRRFIAVAAIVPG